MKLKRISRLVHTVKYLKARQICYRLYYFFNKSPIKHFQDNYFEIRNWDCKWSSPCAFPSRLTSSGFVTFLGESGCVWDHLIWNDPNRSKLWLYNLHYLDELNTIDSEKNSNLLNKLIQQWIEDNPPLLGNGWEPYPLSLRIVNLVKWFSRSDNPIPTYWLTNLSMQAEALFGLLEYHIMGNHLFANGKALIFIGSYLEGSRANQWLTKGLEIIDHEIKEQFHADGGHFELSPMYHAILLWDMCDLVNLAQKSGLEELQLRKKAWQEVIIKGIYWLNVMIHPDQKISFFNDASFGIAPEFNEIEQYVKFLGLCINKKEKDDFSLDWLSHSGYCAISLGAGHKAIIDIAPIGPDYQPGHAHADTLSFELSLYTHRFLVNSGISQYNDGPQRYFERSTAAHNTININDKDSSEVWSGFRVAKRAYPINRIIKKNKENILIESAHNGYRTLWRRNIHRRTWSFTLNKLTMIDDISGRYTKAISRLYFHPHVKVNLIDNDMILCNLYESPSIFISVKGAKKLSLEKSFWYSHFGMKQENMCLVIALGSDKLVTEIRW